MASSSESAAAIRGQLSAMMAISSIDGRSTTGNLHALFGSSIAFFGSFISVKYLGSTENPFKDQGTVMMLVMFFSYLYVLVVYWEIRNGAVNTTQFFRIMYIISGSTVVMLLGYILCGPYVLIFMNPATFVLVEFLLVMFKRNVPNVDEEAEAPTQNPNDTETGEMELPAKRPVNAAEEDPSVIINVDEEAEAPTQNPNDTETGEMELPAEPPADAAEEDPSVVINVDEEAEAPTQNPNDTETGEMELPVIG